MTQKILKGLQMDDKFNAAMKRIEDAMNALTSLHKDFTDREHRPAPSQTDQLIYAKGRMKELSDDFMKLKNS